MDHFLVSEKVTVITTTLIILTWNAVSFLISKLFPRFAPKLISIVHRPKSLPKNHQRRCDLTMHPSQREDQIHVLPCTLPALCIRKDPNSSPILIHFRENIIKLVGDSISKSMASPQIYLDRKKKLSADIGTVVHQAMSRTRRCLWDFRRYLSLRRRFHCDSSLRGGDRRGDGSRIVSVIVARSCLRLGKLCNGKPYHIGFYSYICILWLYTHRVLLMLIIS